MKNFTLKTAGLLLLVLFSTQGMANSPWADEPEEKPETNDQVVTQPMPLEQDDNNQPAMEEVVEPVGLVQTEEAPLSEPTQSTETVQQGDVINTGDTTEIVAVRVLDFPRRGMTIDKVENELGRPSEIIPAIGQPPISRWVYDDRTVYFEHSSVIHVVAK